MTVVIGTAGHIDHGKTALLRALTGIDADRLPEERRRGMTIDVGYAHLRLADGTDLDFVDVPGHDRLVGNMLVGAGEVQAALLVIAADDGPRAQTLEHLALLDGLQIREGIVAVTKVDLVDDARLAEVTERVRALLSGTSLEAAPIIPVSSLSGQGVADLANQLVGLRDRVLAASPASPPGAPVRLAIDRSFVIKGRGSVVTGSLRGGRLERGVLLRLVPGEREVRARELQVHGAAVEAVEGGGRVAVNLASIEVEELPRGSVLTTDPGLRASATMVAVLEPGGRIARATELAPGAVFRLHLGTAQAAARIGRGRFDLVPLDAGWFVARIRLDRPIALADDDRFVLRRTAASPVIGGRVLDAEPPAGPARRRASRELIADLAAEAPIERARALVALHGVLELRRVDPGGDTIEREGPAALEDAALDAVRLAGRLVARSVVTTLEDQALVAVAAAADPARGVPGVSRAELRTALVRALRRAASVDGRLAGAIVDGLLGALVAGGRLSRDGDRLRLPGAPGAPPVAPVAAMDRLERLLSTPGPPSIRAALRLSGCSPEGLRALETAGRVIRIEADLAYAAPAYRDLAALALRLAAAGPLTPAAYRDAAGTSRKYVMAILEDLDRRGILRRTPAGHLPGPRAAVVAAIGQAGA